MSDFKTIRTLLQIKETYSGKLQGIAKHLFMVVFYLFYGVAGAFMVIRNFWLHILEKVPGTLPFMYRVCRLAIERSRQRRKIYLSLGTIPDETKMSLWRSVQQALNWRSYLQVLGIQTAWFTNYLFLCGMVLVFFIAPFIANIWLNINLQDINIAKLYLEQVWWFGIAFVSIFIPFIFVNVILICFERLYKLHITWNKLSQDRKITDIMLRIFSLNILLGAIFCVYFWFGLYHPFLEFVDKFDVVEFLLETDPSIVIYQQPVEPSSDDLTVQHEKTILLITDTALFGIISIKRGKSGRSPGIPQVQRLRGLGNQVG